jgi:ureidoacrylate peracid hydrolase
VHNIDIPQEIVDLAIQRRGRLRLFEDVDPARTAHLIIDMQVGFTTPGAPAEIPNAVGIIENINAISAACREAGVLNVFVQHTLDDESKSTWSNWFDAFWTPEMRAGMYATFADGSPGHALHPSIETEDNDLRINKYRFGAFIKDTSDAHALLTSRGIDTLIITGCATNICCESTARDAMMLNYRVFFVCDATATHTDAEHNGTLATMLLTFADVIDVEDMSAMLTG